MPRWGACVTVASVRVAYRQRVVAILGLGPGGGVVCQCQCQRRTKRALGKRTKALPSGTLGGAMALVPRPHLAGSERAHHSPT